MTPKASVTPRVDARLHMILRLVLVALATAPGLGRRPDRTSESLHDRPASPGSVAMQPAAGLEEPFTRGNPTGCSLSSRKCRCRFGGTEQECWAEGLVKDRLRGMYNQSWTARLLGQSIRLAMQPGEEMAINRYFKLRHPHTTYHGQSTFQPRPTRHLSWIEYNPAVLQAGGSSAGASSTLYNIRQGGGEQLNLSGVARTSVLWVARDGRGRAEVKLEIRNAEDARPFVLNGSAHVLFVRYRKGRFKDVWLARLAPLYREVKLTYAKRRSSEGNWLPFVHDGQLFVSYSLCPHRVLAVDLSSGVCTLAYETTASGCTPKERGSASGVYHAASGHVVGLGHLKSFGSQERRGLRSYGYFHFWFARLSQPPFNITHRSSLFRFPYVLLNHGAASGQPAESDFSVQFALSLRQGGSGNDLMVDIGAGDVLGLTATVSVHAFCNFTGWCTHGFDRVRGFGGIVFPVATDPTAGPGCG